MPEFYGKALKYFEMKKQKKLPKNFDPKTLTISHVGSRGEGISKLCTEFNYQKKNYNFFVPYTLPNELVIAKPKNLSSEGIRAELIEIKTPSSERVNPECKHFFKCGGCLLQHWNLKSYKNWKIEKISHPIRQISQEIEIKPIISSPIKSRRHAKFIAKKNKSKTIIGFNEYKRHYITEINKCIILDKKLIKLIIDIEEAINELLEIGDTIYIHANLLDHGIDLLLDGLSDTSYKNLIRFNESIIKTNVIRLHRTRKDKTLDLLFVKEQASLTNTLYSSIIFPPPGSFLQATQNGENTIIENIIKALANINKRKFICELFAGCGTITLPLLSKNFKVNAYEINVESINAINLASKKQGFVNKISALPRNLKTYPLTSEELSKFDAIIIDPPRSGARDQFLNIAKSEVPIVISISCNINTFIRDAWVLIENNYILKWVQPIDQFLFSPHIEIVCLFERSEAN